MTGSRIPCVGTDHESIGVILSEISSVAEVGVQPQRKAELKLISVHPLLAFQDPSEYNF